jgi:tetratricopeptide (TPR) repeat protein
MLASCLHALFALLWVVACATPRTPELRREPVHVAQAQDLLDQAAQLIERGQEKEAQSLIDQAVAIYMQALDQTPASMAAALAGLGTIYAQAEDHEVAERLLAQSLTLRLELGPNHPGVADSLHRISLYYQGRGDQARAKTFREKSIAALKASLGSEYNVMWRSQAILQTTLEGEFPDFSATLANLAIIYEEQGDRARADPLFARSLEVRTEEFGPEHPRLADLLWKVGMHMLEADNFAGAERNLRRSLAIRETALGPDHIDVAISLSDLVSLYTKVGDYERATALYRRCLFIWDKSGRPETEDTARLFLSLGALHIRTGN